MKQKPVFFGLCVYKISARQYDGFDMKDFDFFLKKVSASLQPATGCTEPVAIALNCATARKHTPGEIKKADIFMDPGLLKTAMFVGIPGASGRGAKLCAALGLVLANPEDGMNIFSKMSGEHEKAATALLPLITISLREDIKDLYMETRLVSDRETTRVITWKEHDRTALVEHPPYSEFVPGETDDTEWMKEFGIEDIVEFAAAVPLEKLAFIEEGLETNLKIAEKGLEMGLGRSLKQLSQKEFWGDSLVSRVQMLTGAGAFARMSGVSLPVMTVTGSGNNGITLFLTVAGAAEKLGKSREKLLRALALALGINLLAKPYLGTISPICSCGVASGMAASAGIVYLMDGSAAQMMGAIRSMLGSIAGMICDGAKEGCANKIAVSSAAAAFSAMTAVQGFSVSSRDGILAKDMHELFGNVGYLGKTGMDGVNRAILHIMEAGADYAQ